MSHRDHDGLRWEPIVPAWPVPPNVGGLFTTRRGGVSTGCWSAADGSGGLNLGAACGDAPQRVAHNRRLLQERAGIPIRWLTQVHEARVIEVPAAGDRDDVVEAADAQVTEHPGIGLGILVADCLPVLLADRAGSIVGAVHAGWRGLAGGVVENAIALMRRRRPGADVVAWLGPCIGPDAFEVGEDVLDAFVSPDPRARACFTPRQQSGKWLADLRGLARLRLADAGVSSVTGVAACTVTDSARFWSYRRDRECGRMAALIWLRRASGSDPAA